VAGLDIAYEWLATNQIWRGWRMAEKRLRRGFRRMARQEAKPGNALRFCPACGARGLETQGSVFIEDGPWLGQRYAQEGYYDRYRCPRCGAAFGLLPEPLLCACGKPIEGQIGSDCDVLDADTDSPRYLCGECMRSTPEVAR
jgi:hypothetical protein